MRRQENERPDIRLGNEFLKFQDAEEIGAYDLADAFEQMWEKKRYHEILFMIDTCQANTMYSKLYSPNIIATGSSELDQSSYSHHADNDVGVAVIDRYTYYNLEFLETQVRDINSKKTVGDLFDSYDYEKIHSHAGVRYDLFRGGAEAARSRLITDFFGNVQNVEVDGSKNTTLEEDMLALSKTIAALKKKADEADEAEAAEKKNANETGKLQLETRKQVHLAKPLTDDNWWTKKLIGLNSKDPIPYFQRIPPLRPIPLNIRPLAKRAVAWSCDGDMAVAADDSVHVFIPSFPDPSAAGNDQDRDQDMGSESDSDEEDDEGDVKNVDLLPAYLLRRRKNAPTRQAQFVTGQRQVLVSHPRVSPKVNRELFEVAGQPFVSIDGVSGSRPVGEGWGSDDGSDEDGKPHEEYVDEENRRPILAVLTSAGYVAFYGDAASAGKAGAGFKFMGRDEGMLRQRDLASWAILFGAGERFAVPEQKTLVSQKICGIAWASQIAPGQALFAYITDSDEVAVLSIQSVFSAPENAVSAEAASRSNSERNIWRVVEVARFAAAGPHPPITPWDPDWVPCGTTFGLRWSPWLSAPDSKTCILSYCARNYIGFRKITLQSPWIRGTGCGITVAPSDTHGHCTFLSTDSFVEFEDAIWTKGHSKVVRGLIATGFHVKPFEVSISGSQRLSFNPNPHPTSDCGITYQDHGGDRPSTNPIVDLVIHPPNMATPTAIPTYTLVRLSATSINHDWFYTNTSLTEISSHNSDAKPQWAVDLAAKLAVLVPADAHMRHTVGSDGSDAESVTSGKEPGHESGDELSDGEEVDIEKAVTGPEVHPTRFRFHGLAAAPGGRATVVLVSAHSTQTPDRIGWWGLRSSLMFGFRERPRRKMEGVGEGMVVGREMTTEGRMVDWMYGAGPGVGSITGGHDGAAGNRERKVPEMFEEVIARQRCNLCGEKIALGSEADGRQGMSVCANGHFFSTCGASGLAIQAPGYHIIVVFVG
ncbi:hypothetical protein DL765_009832 [Monosporascus sp. GIB2]|nr:hypothetical protein DL765_009832 [Monosporascus sp. GIB2]